MLQAKIKEYMKLTNEMNGVETLLNMLQEQILDMIKSDADKEEARAFQKTFLTHFNSRQNELEKNMVALYEKYYTEEDMNALIAYRKSPIGEKVAQVSPHIVKESMKFSNEFSQEIIRAMTTTFKA